MHLVDQARVVEVRVRDQDTDKGRVAAIGQPRDGWQRHVVTGIRGQRLADVEDQTGALALQLDARTADLVRAAVDANAHSSADQSSHLSQLPLRARATKCLSQVSPQISLTSAPPPPPAR